MNAAFMPCSRASPYPLVKMNRLTDLRRVMLAGFVLLTAALMPAGAEPPAGVDHERARAARARGEVLPLVQILNRVERDFGGRVIEVELERDDGQLRYELELLLPDGRVIELEFDARTGELVKLEGARLETVFKPRSGAGAASR